MKPFCARNQSEARASDSNLESRSSSSHDSVLLVLASSRPISDKTFKCGWFIADGYFAPSLTSIGEVCVQHALFLTFFQPGNSQLAVNLEILQASQQLAKIPSLENTAFSLYWAHTTVPRLTNLGCEILVLLYSSSSQQWSIEHTASEGIENGLLKRRY